MMGGAMIPIWLRELQRVALLMLIVFWVVTAPTPPARAQEPEVLSLADLLLAAADYSGEVVTIEGELVGDYGFRRDGWMWTQLNDDSYARAAVADGGDLTGDNTGIGVRVRSAFVRDLDPAGGYRLEGPLVRITGVWRYHDPDRGGESYLDASAVELIDAGRRLQEGPDWTVFIAGLVLVAASLLMWRMRESKLESP